MILGLKITEFIRRLIYAAIIAAVNLLIWLYIPALILSSFNESLMQTILYFSITITAFSVTSIIMKGHILEIVAMAAAGVTSAFYLFTITQGGVLTMQQSGFTVTLKFQRLLYLLILPSLLTIMKAAWSAIHNSVAKRVEVEETFTIS